MTIGLSDADERRAVSLLPGVHNTDKKAIVGSLCLYVFSGYHRDYEVRKRLEEGGLVVLQRFKWDHWKQFTDYAGARFLVFSLQTYIASRTFRRNLSTHTHKTLQPTEIDPAFSGMCLWIIKSRELFYISDDGELFVKTGPKRRHPGNRVTRS